MPAAVERCPSCGAGLGGRAGCQAAFDEISAAAWSGTARGAVHNLVVDAYAMQHPEEYGVSAKSYAAHLAGLCWGVEQGGDPGAYWSIARWLDGARALDKPPLLHARGSLTIADVRGAASDEEHRARVRAWAAAVWEAYAPQHATARAWLRDAVAAAGTSARRRRP